MTHGEFDGVEVEEKEGGREAETRLALLLGRGGRGRVSWRSIEGRLEDGNEEGDKEEDSRCCA